MLPTIRSILLFTAGMPVVLALILYDPGLWWLGWVYAVGWCALCVLDAASAARWPDLDASFETPAIGFIGEVGAIDIALTARPGRSALPVRLLCDLSGDADPLSAREVLLQAVRNTLGPPGSGPPGQDGFDELIADNASLGMRYIAVVRDGEVLFSAGESGFATVATLDSGETHMDRLDGLARMVMLPPHEAGREGRGPPSRPSHPLTVVEYEPRLAMELEQNAARNFALGLAGAGLLTLLAAVFWRISSRAQAAQIALCQDRDLRHLRRPPGPAFRR